jgi:hypothetical protein
VADEKAEPEGAVEHVQGVLDVQVRPQLAGRDPSGDGGRASCPAVGEEAAAEVLGEVGVALGVGDDLPDESALP